MIAKGLPASPGAAVGQVVFSAEDAEEWHAQGKSVILVFPHLILYLLIMVIGMLPHYGIFVYVHYPFFILFCIVPVDGGRGVFLSKTLFIEIFLSTIYGSMSVFLLL